MPRAGSRRSRWSGCARWSTAIGSARCELGASPVLAIATSAARDAANGREFVESLEGGPVRTAMLTGEEEARMTFRGVTSARPVVAGTLVCDIGGGSTELVLGGPGGVEWASQPEHGLRPPLRAPPARRPADDGPGGGAAGGRGR